jgi:CheY-like chemotaxis protein
VLVVDDDVHALRSAARMLESAGHEVTVATSGAEALARVRDPGRPDVAAVDVALVDVVMPVMSGPALASALRGQLADLPVVLMTGFGADLLGDDAVGLVVLAKPLDPEVVDAALRDAAFRGQVAIDPSG